MGDVPGGSDQSRFLDYWNMADADGDDGCSERKRNALASSIVLVCRPRVTGSLVITRHQFISALKNELPSALAHLQRGNVAPVYLAQSAIGPGMSIFTRYTRVLDAEGNTLTVRDALALINQIETKCCRNRKATSIRIRDGRFEWVLLVRVW